MVAKCSASTEGVDHDLPAAYAQLQEERSFSLCVVLPAVDSRSSACGSVALAGRREAQPGARLVSELPNHVVGLPF